MTHLQESDYARIVAERDHARARWDEYKRLAEATALDLNASEAERDRYRDALEEIIDLRPNSTEWQAVAREALDA